MPKAKRKTLALLSTSAIADLSAVAPTTLYTVPIATTMIPAFGWLKVAGNVGANLVASIGLSTAVTDWIPEINGDNLDAAGDVIFLVPLSLNATPLKLQEYTAGEIIVFNVSVAGNAVAGTLYLFGFEDAA